MSFSSKYANSFDMVQGDSACYKSNNKSLVTQCNIFFKSETSTLISHH